MSHPIPVIVNGAFGRMGRIACLALENQSEFCVVAQLGREDNLQDTMIKTQARIVVDVTRADCVFANALRIIENNAHPVIGTSGLNEAQLNHLRELCEKKQLGGIIAPNFSMGAVLMMHFSALAARFFPDVEIIEAHHPQKQDAPSGTALKTADLIHSVRAQAPQIGTQSHTLAGARGASYHHIPIHSVRLPGILARQQVIFGAPGETLTVAHDSIDRHCFIPGIRLACQQVTTLTRLHYGLEHLMGLKDQSNACTMPS